MAETSGIKELQRVYARGDLELSYKRISEVPPVTVSRERPWTGYLRPVEHDDGPTAWAQAADCVFQLSHSTMLTVPGVIYGHDLSQMTEDQFRALMPVPLLGTFLCRNDTKEVVGYSARRGTIVEPEVCCEHVFRLCEGSGFRVEAAGLISNRQVLALFARHECEPFQLGANKFFRFLYFITAFGSGLAPMLVHAAYHPISGALLLVDVQRVGLRRVRGLQILRRSVQGTQATLSSLSLSRWDDDWAKYCDVLRQMSEHYATPMDAARILTMTMDSYAKRQVLWHFVDNMKDSLRKYATLNGAMKHRLAQWRDSHILSTPECLHSILGVLLFGCHVKYGFSKELPADTSWAVQLSSSGLTVKRNLYDVARKIIYGQIQ